MKPPRYWYLAVVLVAATSGTALAQPTPPPQGLNRCTSLSRVGGVATASSDTGGIVGGAAGWAIVPRLGIEGDVAWLDRAGNEKGFTASFNALANLGKWETAVPYLKGGFGLYRAWFDDPDDTVPEFYRRRMHMSASETSGNVRRSRTRRLSLAAG